MRFKYATVGQQHQTPNRQAVGNLKKIDNIAHITQEGRSHKRQDVRWMSQTIRRQIQSIRIHLHREAITNVAYCLHDRAFTLSRGASNGWPDAYQFRINQPRNGRSLILNSPIPPLVNGPKFKNLVKRLASPSTSRICPTLFHCKTKFQRRHACTTLLSSLLHVAKATFSSWIRAEIESRSFFACSVHTGKQERSDFG